LSKSIELGDADELFTQFFDRWYDDETRALKSCPGTEPDVVQYPDLVGRTAAEISPLEEPGFSKSLERVQAMLSAAQGDWPDFLKVQGEVDLEWVRVFDEFFRPEVVAELISISDPEDFGNRYVIYACEFGAVLGQCLRQRVPRLVWVPSWPYWESYLFDSQTGFRINVFHWAIKKLSSYGVDDGFAAKLEACVGMLEGKE
jgi:hypothetical protein